jgi:hypothetical protein
MPKQAKNQKKKKNSLSTSTSSKSKSKSGKDDKCKKLTCCEKIKLDVDVLPNVKVSREKTKNASFDVALDIKHRARCVSVVPIKEKSISNCHGQCLFRVKIENDFDVVPKILNECRFPSAEFDVDIDAITKQKCNIVKKK